MQSSSFGALSTMDRLLPLLAIVLFTVATSDAAQSGEVYWNRVLPNTPMPSAIKNLLANGAYTEEKAGTNVNVNKGGVNVNTGKGTNVNVGHGNVGVHAGKGTNVNVGHGNVGVHTGKGTTVGVGHGGVRVNTGKGKSGGTTVNVGKGGVGVNVKTPPKKKPVYVKASPFYYLYAASDTQIHDDPTIALFFVEKDLKAGTKITLDFTPTTSATAAAFISRQEAKSIPFASEALPQILDRFSVDPNSIKAESIKQTLSECEEPPMSGEHKQCATSLESMVEFATTSLNTRNVVAVSTNIDNKNSRKQQYMIESSKKLSGSDDMVVCHAQDYAYAVFYCHTTHATKAYEVSMVGTDRTRLEAMAVCHSDTAEWNPNHVAFRVLGVKPGTVPVCHFLPQDHVVWSKKMN